MINFQINADMFLVSLRNLSHEFTEKALKMALLDVADQIITDTTLITPIDTGMLTGAGNIAMKGFQNIRPSGMPKASDESEPDREGLDDFEVRVSYNNAYARKVHENYNKPEIMKPGAASIRKLGDDAANVGYKFLEKTVNKNTNNYIRLLEYKIKMRSKEILNG